MDKKYQVFISSTYTDLIDLRREIASSVLKMTEIPAAMEDFGAVDSDALSYIKAVIDKCDYYVLVIAGRYGSVDESGVSYTEQEYDYALSKGKTVLVFIFKNIEDLPSNHVDGESSQKKRLHKFREKASKGRLVEYWNDRKEVVAAVTIALANAFRTHPGIGWVRADSIDRTQTVEIRRLEFENQMLRQEIAKLKENTDNFSYIEADICKIYSIELTSFVNRKMQRHFINLSWEEIFKLFAPLVRRNVYTLRIREKFADILCSVLKNSTENREFGDISIDVYEEIEAFFMGLDLVEPRDDNRLYLTNIGRKYLYSLRS